MESWNASAGEEKMKRKDVILKSIPERYGGIDNTALVDVPELWSPRCSPFRIHQRVYGTFPHMTCVTFEHPRSTESKKCQKERSWNDTRTLKRQQDPDALFWQVTAVICLSLLIGALFSCAASSRTWYLCRDRQKCQQQNQRGMKKKLLKRKGLLCGTCGFSQKERCVRGKRNMYRECTDAWTVVMVCGLMERQGVENRSAQIRIKAVNK